MDDEKKEEKEGADIRVSFVVDDNTVIDQDEDGTITIDMVVNAMAITGDQALGQYKHRKGTGFLDLTPKNAHLRVRVPSEDGEAPVAEITYAVFDQLMLGVERTVLGAEERHNEREAKKREQIEGSVRKKMDENKKKPQSFA